VKPKRTLDAVLRKLAEVGAAHDREVVQRLVPIQRYACERHGWHPSGPGSLNMDALASLCPSCIDERKQKQREEEAPEVHTLDVYGGDERAKKLWQDSCDARERAGQILGGSAAEREIVRAIDDARRDELYELKLTRSDRRRSHWGRKLRVHTQTYEPPPIKAGG
jgi:hypothetical protein